MNRNTIKISNIYLPHISTRRLLSKNINNQYTEMVISEYDLEETLDLFNNVSYSPKEIYTRILDHLYEILGRNIHNTQAIFSFSIHQNTDENDYEIIEKDIQVEAKDSSITIEIVFEKIKNIIQYMQDTRYTLKHCLNPDLHLTFVKHEIHNSKENIINKEKIFKSNSRVSCTESNPNILFCNCGHLCICIKCWEFMSDKKYCCPICREYNTIVRELLS